LLLIDITADFRISLNILITKFIAYEIIITGKLINIHLIQSTFLQIFKFKIMKIKILLVISFALLIITLTNAQPQTIHNLDAEPTITKEKIFLFGQSANQNKDQITLDFEGLGNSDQIVDFYNGGESSQGFSGFDFGIYFGGNTLAIIDEDAGGTGNFANEPSPSTIMFFLEGSAVMNVPNGFVEGFSFYYTSSEPGVVYVYDGLDATGNLIATASFPALTQGQIGGDPNGYFDNWQPFGVSFEGVAKSVDFTGVQSKCGFDNVTFGNVNPPLNIPPVAQGVPDVQPIELMVGEVYSLTLSFLSPETDQITDAIINTFGLSDFNYTVSPGNVCTVEMNLPGTMDNVGLHEIEIVATDSGTPPESTTVYLNFFINGSGFMNCLAPGWQYFSSYIVPENPQLEALMAEVNANDALVIMLSKTGIYWPEFNINLIGDWNSNEGYKIKMASPGCVIYEGDEVENKTAELTAGANILPVLSSQNIQSADIFDQIQDVLVFAYDLTGQLVYWPDGGLYTLQTLEPGKGYLVSITEDAPVTYPAAKGQNTDNRNIVRNVENAPWKVSKTGTPHLISIYQSALEEFEPGIIIGVFNSEGLCAGITQYADKYENLPLVAYGDDYITENVDGMMEGEPFFVKVFTPDNKEVVDVYPTWNQNMPNVGQFEENGLSAITSFKTSTSIVQVDLDNMKIFPNPNKGVFNIIGINEMVRVSIISNSGQELKTFSISQSAEIDLGGFSKGIYFLKVVSENHVRIEKIIIK
jgi:hypothetical protein